MRRELEIILDRLRRSKIRKLNHISYQLHLQCCTCMCSIFDKKDPAFYYKDKVITTQQNILVNKCADANVGTWVERRSVYTTELTNTFLHVYETNRSLPEFFPNAFAK